MVDEYFMYVFACHIVIFVLFDVFNKNYPFLADKELNLVLNLQYFSLGKFQLIPS